MRKRIKKQATDVSYFEPQEQSPPLPAENKLGAHSSITIADVKKILKIHVKDYRKLVASAKDQYPGSTPSQEDLYMVFKKMCEAIRSYPASNLTEQRYQNLYKKEWRKHLEKFDNKDLRIKNELQDLDDYWEVNSKLNESSKNT